MKDAILESSSNGKLLMLAKGTDLEPAPSFFCSLALVKFPSSCDGLLSAPL